MQKNVKGFIALIAGLLSVVLLALSTILRTEKISGTDVMFYGRINVLLAVCALLCAIIAIVFGVKSKKDAAKKGPRSAGIIIGVIMVILSTIGLIAAVMYTMLTDYVNNGKDAMVYSIIKDNPDSEQAFNELAEKVRNGEV